MKLSNLIFTISGMGLVAGVALTTIMITLISTSDISTQYWFLGGLFAVTCVASFIGDRAGREILRMHQNTSA